MSNWTEDIILIGKNYLTTRKKNDHRKYMSGYILTKIIKLCIHQVVMLVNMKTKR